jgi:hypothetical protein
MNSEDSQTVLRELFSLGSGRRLIEALTGLIDNMRKNRGDVLSRPRPTMEEFYQSNGGTLALEEMKDTLNALFEEANKVR